MCHFFPHNLLLSEQTAPLANSLQAHGPKRKHSMNEQGRVGTFDALQRVCLCATFTNLLPPCPTVIVMFSPKYEACFGLLFRLINVFYGILIVSEK